MTFHIISISIQFYTAIEFSKRGFRQSRELSFFNDKKKPFGFYRMAASSQNFAWMSIIVVISVETGAVIECAEIVFFNLFCF
jgi:hypothetical protein